MQCPLFPRGDRGSVEIAFIESMQHNPIIERHYIIPLNYLAPITNMSPFYTTVTW